MKAKLSEKVVKEIQNLIKVALVKRGFHAEFIKFCEEDGRIVFETETFQTVPVIFETIKIENFSSSVWHKSGDDYGRVSIDVHCRYTHFDGGNNGATIFEFYCEYGNDYVIHHEIH